MADLQGYDQLQRRLKAIASTGEGYMKFVGAVAVGELKRNIPRKTSNTGRSIHVARTDNDSAVIEGNAIAKLLDTGTGIYGPRKKKITPKVKKALAFYRGSFGPGGSLRLTGTPRKGSAGAGATRIVVRSVKGMKPRPYVDKSIDATRRKLGVELVREVVENWNRAA
jgi:hypothetical protein